MFQAESVRDAAFGCDWVGTPIPFQRCLMFIIAMGNKKFQLTAGKFVPVSNLTMMNVSWINILHCFFTGKSSLVALASFVLGFSILLRHDTISKTRLDERSARRKELYLITHNTHKRETFMIPAEFEPVIPVSEMPQTQVLDRATTGICKHSILILEM